MRATALIAWRFMLKGTEKGHFSPMTLFAWIAIGVGVGAMCSLLSVMYGLESSLRENVLRAYPHIIIRQLGAAQAVPKEADLTQRLRQTEGVERVIPYLETEMIAQSHQRALGVVVWGIPEGEWERISEGLKEGQLPSLETPLPEGVLGTELGHHLSIDIGEKLSLISPIRRAGALASVPRTHTMLVSGFYQSGHYDFDKQYLYLPLADVQDFLGTRASITGWHIWTQSLEAADEVAQTLRNVLPEGWDVQSWTSFNEALFHSLKLEQLAMFLILSFAVIIAVMNIAITLMMHVSHKRKNIGILRALGASADQIKRIFVYQGAFIGLIGISLGAVLSVVLIWFIERYYEFPDIYYQRSVPIEVRPLSIALVYLVAVILVFLATIYPAKKAASLDPIEAIRE